MLWSGMCCALGLISSRTGKMVGSDGLGHGYNTASTNGTSQGTTTNVLAEAYQRAKPTAARGGTNTPGNHKLLHPFRNSRVVVCGSSVITELVKVGQPNRPVTKGNAYGKGKHKIASIIDNAKDKVMETEEHAKQTTMGAVRKAKKAASVTFRKAKETVCGSWNRYEASFIAEVVDTIDCELDLKQVSTSAHLSGIEACTQVSLLFHHKENVCATISSFKSLQTHVMILERKKL
ncbi:hypothetical protein Tco_0664751 [Tanacetum coccineum]